MNVNKLSFSTGFFFVYFHEVEIASKSRYYILIYEDRYCCGLKSCVHTEYNKKEIYLFTSVATILQLFAQTVLYGRLQDSLARNLCCFPSCFELLK